MGERLVVITMSENNKRVWEIRNSGDNGALVHWHEDSVSAPFLGIVYLGTIKPEQEETLYKGALAIKSSMTEESTMIATTVGKIRELFPDAVKGNVGFFDIEGEDSDVIFVIEDYAVGETNDVGLWWIHQYIE
jgi:hypothetical protein